MEIRNETRQISRTPIPMLQSPKSKFLIESKPNESNIRNNFGINRRSNSFELEQQIPLRVGQSPANNLGHLLQWSIDHKLAKFSR